MIFKRDPYDILGLADINTGPFFEQITCIMVKIER